MLEALAIYLCVTFFVYTLDPSPAPEGYTHYDPCIKCGEDWEFYPANNRTKDSTIIVPQTMTKE